MPLFKFKSKSKKDLLSNGGNHKGQGDLSLRRVSSSTVVQDKDTQIKDSFDSAPSRRSRAHTFTNGVNRPLPNGKLSKGTSPSQLLSTEDIHMLENMHCLASPRHFLRRKALIEDDIKGGLGLSSLSMSQSAVTIRVEEDGNKMEGIQETKQSLSLRDIVEMLLIKNSVFLKSESFEDYNITAYFQGNTEANVDLDLPSVQFAARVVEIKPKLLTVLEEPDVKETQTFKTVQDCLSFFSTHGLVELPLTHEGDEDTFRLPRVQPIDSIVTSWSDLPIDPQVKEALSKVEHQQQLAIWEFIYTEHSHIRHLETIINVFMRCLELIRRAQLLTEKSYHNVFGYMEDIYHAHDQFWTWTMEPVLEKVYESGLPLDLNEIIQRFPEFGAHFEIYQQHCQLEALNLKSLKRAKENIEFAAYLKWCESQPECHRLELTQLLATPMQRLTRYPLLLTAIIKKTTQPHIKQRLEHLWGEMYEFVQDVNSGIRIQQETERVRDAMNRITGFHVMEIPSELKDVVHPHTHLDLLAPMPNVEVDRSRVLMLEGTLKYRDHVMTKPVPLHVFLFTDMLLITKLSSRKGEDKYVIIREPYKIDRLVLHQLEPGSFCVVVLNEFHVAKAWFILKANTADVTDQWMDQISTAQHFYTEAVERRAQNWKLLQSLQGERILNGIEGIESLSASLSQSLWSISSLNGAVRGRNRSLTTSTDSLLRKRESSPCIDVRPKHPQLTRSMSGDSNENKGATFPRLHKAAPTFLTKQSHLVDTHLKLGRTVSLGQLEECPEKKTDTSTGPLSNLLLYKRHSAFTFGERSQDLDLLSLRNIQTSPLSDDSGTESGNTSVDELSHSASHSLDSSDKSDECSGAVVAAQYKTEPPSSTQEELDSVEGRTSEKSVSSIDSTPPMPLKSILRGSRNTSREESVSSNSQLYGSQFKAAINRVSSDDSGIAMKPVSDLEQNRISKSLMEFNQNKCVPLSHSLPPLERISCYDSDSAASRPKKHVRLQIRSSSEATLSPLFSPEHVNRYMTITSVDETNESGNMTSDSGTYNSEHVPSLTSDDNASTGSNTVSETESNATVSSDSLTGECRPTDVVLDLKKESIEVAGIESPRFIPESRGISLCRQATIEEREPLTSTPPEISGVSTTKLTSGGNEVVKNDPEQSSVLVENKDAHVVERYKDTHGIPVPDAVQNSSPNSDPSDKANKTAMKGKNNTIRKQNSRKKVHELVQAFDSSALIVPCPSSKKTISQAKPSKLPVTYKRTRSAAVVPFTRQYAKRYTDNVSNKGNKLSTEQSTVSESKTANKSQPPSSSPSSKPVSKRSPSKIPLSPSHTCSKKISESQRSIIARRKPSPAAAKQSDAYPMGNDTQRTSPRISRHERSSKSPRPRTICEDSSIDHDTLTKLVALSPRLRTTNMKEYNSTTSLSEGVKLTAGQMKQTGGAERRLSALTPDLSSSLHSASTFKTAKRACSMKSVHVSVTLNRNSHHPSKTLRKLSSQTSIANSS